MKTRILIFVLLTFLSIPTQAIHFFKGSYEEAREKAKAENKNLFISFTASWCGPCRLMEKIVFDNEKVTQYMDEHYIALHLNIEFEEYMLLQQRVNPEEAGGIPHVCILTPDEEVLKESGSMTVHQMMKFLEIDENRKPLRHLARAEEIKPLYDKPRLFLNRTRYSDVCQQAQLENKNMLLCFSSHFCGPCRQMEEITFQIPEIIKQVNNRYVTGYFEVGDPIDRALCYRFNNTQIGIPYLVIASPDGKIYRKHIGYLDSTAFVAFIQPVQDTAYEKVSEHLVSFRDSKPSMLSKFLYNQSRAKWKLRITATINTTTLKTSGTLSGIDFNYRCGYEMGFSLAHEGSHFAVAPGLSFISKGGRNKEVTLRQNYLELPVKLSWIYWNSYQGHWKGLSVSPYGSVRIGEKLKNHSADLPDELFKTQRFDYGLRLATNMRYSSFDFEAGYTLGLCNISDYRGGKLYNRGFFLNISLCL